MFISLPIMHTITTVWREGGREGGEERRRDLDARRH